MGALGRSAGQHLLARRCHHVAAEDQIGGAGSDAHRGDVFRPVGDLEMAHHRAVFLRQAHHVDDAGALAFEMRRHAENMADGDDAGAADAGDHDRPGAIERRQLRIGKDREHGAAAGQALHVEAADELSTFDRHEARAEAFEAGIILVAGRLVDLALAAKGRLDRCYGDTVGLDAAIAAAFADELIDEDALVGIGELAALAPPAFLGGTGLVIDEDRCPFDIHELLLHRIEVVAVMEGDMGRELGARIFLGLIGDDSDAIDAFGTHLAGDQRHAEPAVMRLAASHGDGIVIEDLVGDVGIRRERRADGEEARMIIGAVAQILENMLALGERRLTHPIGAFAAHLRRAMSVAGRHRLDHPVAADAGIAAGAFGQDRR